jgi:glycosyltransferase involved in cell wall biosynthesis
MPGGFTGCTVKFTSKSVESKSQVNMSDVIKISIIICTYNRCQLLAKALDSIAASILGRTVEWEVLVVDNNSRDETRRVVEQFCCRYPGRFRYLFEPQQGKSYALNTGLREVKADVVAFTDDDVTVESSWLQNLTQPLRDTQWAGTAGRICPGHEFSPPAWLAISGKFSLLESLGQFDQGYFEGPLHKPPFGANMAFRRIMFDKYGGFRTDLGRRGKSLIGNEETEFSQRLMAAGEPLCYVPSAVVHNPVSQEHLSKKYLRSYWFAHGRSMARQAGQQLSIWRAPRSCIGGLKRTLQWMSSLDRRWFMNPQARFFCELHALHALGEVVESCYLYWTVRQSMGKKGTFSASKVR